MTYKRQLAYFLRHNDNYRFDSHDWREVRYLVEKHDFSFRELKKMYRATISNGLSSLKMVNLSELVKGIT